jgi:hypothetical protein
MKPTSQPHDPLDELLAAAVHGELTAAQRAELDALLQHDPAARAAYQEIQLMHDLLEKNHREVKPDPNFEDRMISGVRRRVREESRRETPRESALVLWRGLRAFWGRPSWKSYAGALAIILILAGVSFDGFKRRETPEMFALLSEKDLPTQDKQLAKITTSAQPILTTAHSALMPPAPAITAGSTVLSPASQQGNVFTGGSVTAPIAVTSAPSAPAAPAVVSTGASGTMDYLAPGADSPQTRLDAEAKLKQELQQGFASKARDLDDAVQQQDLAYQEAAQKGVTISGYVDTSRTYQFAGAGENGPVAGASEKQSQLASSATSSALTAAQSRSVLQAPPVDKQAVAAFAARASAPLDLSDNKQADADTSGVSSTVALTPPEPTRKLVRDATLDLEVKSYQPTVDTITELAKADGGYLDSSSSQRGGNGKLQGTVIAKVAPEKLDAFLLKLRELGTLKNQSVSTEDVTKDYYDTQARLDNSRRMETQLQELLKRDNGKISELLQVERELGRVRGEIEQMQGQLKLYDFQVQYATVTISVAEKDLNKAAAYLLQEHDQFALFVHDVEAAFAQAKSAADTYKAQILNADLEHESDNTMSATLAFSVPPDQVDAFLAKVKLLGRVDNFTRTTTRVANDGGDSDEPADETRTDKDRAQVQLTIRADDESPRQQTQLAIASTGDIDTQARQLKDNAAASGAAVTASSFQRETDGTETATISFRLALAKVGDFMPSLEKLGRVESLSVHSDDRPGQAAADANAPAEIDLSLHNVAAVSIENEPPRQATQLAVVSTGNVDAQAQQVKSDALKAGVNVTGSTFSRSPDGTEQAALTFRLPLAQAADFTAALEKLGRIESLAIQRNDVTGPNSTDPNAPAEIDLTLHNEPAIVAENRGVWPTMRHLLGGGVTAFLHSVEMVGVLAAFLAPWLAAVAVIAFAARRVWVMRQAARAR